MILAFSLIGSPAFVFGGIKEGRDLALKGEQAFKQEDYHTAYELLSKANKELNGRLTDTYLNMLTQAEKHAKQVPQPLPNQPTRPSLSNNSPINLNVTPNNDTQNPISEITETNSKTTNQVSNEKPSNKEIYSEANIKKLKEITQKLFDKQYTPSFDKNTKTQAVNVHDLSPIVKESHGLIEQMAQSTIETLFSLAKQVGLNQKELAWTAQDNGDQILAKLPNLDSNAAKTFKESLVKSGNKLDTETGCVPNVIFTLAYRLTALSQEIVDYATKNYSIDASAFEAFFQLGVLSANIEENYKESGGCIPGIINRLMVHTTQVLKHLLELEEQLENSGVTLEALLSTK